MRHPRRYQMTRVAAGDYLLPSNDARTLWRITSYVEDGSLMEVRANGTERPVRGTFWSTWYRDMPEPDTDVESLLQWGWDGGWREYVSMLRTRQEAIEEALQRS